MHTEDLPFRLIRINSEDEVIARTNKQPSRWPRSLRDGRQALSEEYDPVSAWGEDYCEERSGEAAWHERCLSDPARSLTVRTPPEAPMPNLRAIFFVHDRSAKET
jgi:hypothetical protein